MIVTAVMSMYSGTAARVVTADGCSADLRWKQVFYN